MIAKTKGQYESEISEAVIKFEKEFMGRGPLETKTYIIDDIVLVRLKNVLTQAELKLANAEDRSDGRDLIKRVRIALLEQGRPLLEAAIEKILSAKRLGVANENVVLGAGSTEILQRIVVYPGRERYRIHAKVEVIPLAEAQERLAV